MHGITASLPDEGLAMEMVVLLESYAVCCTKGRGIEDGPQPCFKCDPKVNKKISSRH